MVLSISQQASKRLYEKHIDNISLREVTVFV